MADQELKDVGLTSGTLPSVDVPTLAGVKPEPEDQLVLPEVTVRPDNEAGEGPVPVSAASPEVPAKAAEVLGAPGLIPAAPADAPNVTAVPNLAPEHPALPPEPPPEEKAAEATPEEKQGILGAVGTAVAQALIPGATAEAPFVLHSERAAQDRQNFRAALGSPSGPPPANPADNPTSSGQGIAPPPLTHSDDIDATQHHNYGNTQNMGNPYTPDWEGRNIVTIEAPNGTPFRVNRVAAPYFEGFLHDLSETGYHITSGGGYNLRNIRGGNELSQHAFGLAIDIAPERNPSGETLVTDLPPNIQHIADKWHMQWGGNWNQPKDAMHFQWDGPDTQQQLGYPTDWGMQHNNPLNLRVPGSLLPAAQGGFQAFPNMEQGIQAASKTLDSYYNGTHPVLNGVPARTIQQIVSTWSPPGENKTQELVNRAAAFMHVDPNQALNLQDPATKFNLIKAMIANEHGGLQPVPDSVIGRALQSSPSFVASSTPPAPEWAGRVQLPSYVNQAIPAGVSTSYNPRNGFDDRTFQAAHKDALNPFKAIGYEFGMNVLGTAISMLGIPGDFQHLKEWLGGGYLNHMPLSWTEHLNQKDLPTSDEVKDRLRTVLDYNFINPSPTSQAGEFGRVAGQAVAGSGPFVGAGLVAGLAGAERFFKPGSLLFNTMHEAGHKPLKYAFKEGFEYPIMAGLGANEVGNIYTDVFGEGAHGTNLAEIVGGLLLSARIPVVERAANFAGKIAQRGARLTGLMKDPAKTLQGMDLAQAHALVSQTIQDQITDAMDRAKAEVSNIVPANPQLAGYSGTTLNQMMSDIYHAELAHALGEITVVGQALERGINPNIGRDVGKTLALRKQIEQDAVWNMANKNRDPADYPAKVINGIFDGEAAPSLVDAQGNPIKAYGLSPAVSMKTAMNTYERLEQAVRNEQAKAQPNPAALGTLNKLSNSLLNDIIGTGVAGLTPQEETAFHRWADFQRQLKDLKMVPEIDHVLSTPRNDIGRITAVGTLDQWVREGTKGAEMASMVDKISQLRGTSGSDNLHELIGDSLRQRFLEQVAPNGYVNMNAYLRFREKYGAWLDKPEYQAVNAQIKAAAERETGALQALSLGKSSPSTFGNSFSAENQRYAQAALWLNNPVEQVIGALHTGPGQEIAARQVFKELGRDTTGAATDGFIRILSNQAVKDGAAGLSKWGDENPGLVRVINGIDPDFEHRLKDLSSVTGKAGMTAQLTDLALRWAGARLGGMTAHETGSGFVMAAAGSRFARQVFASLTPQQSQEMIGLLLSDQSAYNAFVKSAGGNMAAFYQLHAYLPGLPLGIDQGSAKDAPNFGTPPGSSPNPTPPQMRPAEPGTPPR